MKYFLRTIAVICLLGLMLPDASAQVSVRRSGSRSEPSSSRKSEKPGKDSKKPKGNSQSATSSRSTDATTRPEAPARPDGPNRPDGVANRPTPPGNARPDAAARPDATTAAPTRRVTPKKGVQPALVDGNTQRQQSFAEYQRREEGYTPWQHVVYRELDLTKGSNASLYFPQEPQDGLTNLFRVIFDAFCTGKLKAYEFLDGREIFDAKYEVKVPDVLDKFQVMYQQRPGVGQGATTQYVVEEMDVPCNEVLSYYIKERWEFNQKNSKYGPRILAICPVVHRAGDFGGEAVNYPMFWINYEDLRPMLREHLVMSDGMNNTPRFTMEEFFTMQQYEGDIYKVQNTRGLSLMQQYPNADTLKIMQAKIEAQLRGFGDSIWIHEPTDAELAAQDSIQRAARAERRAARRSSDSRASRRDSDSNSASAESSSGTKQNRRTKETVDLEAVADAQEAKADEIDQRIEQTGKAHSAKRSARRSR